MDIDDERLLARREFFDSLPGRRLELPFRPVPGLLVELLEASAVARMHRRENSFPDHSTRDTELTPTMNGWQWVLRGRMRVIQLVGAFVGRY